MPAPLTPTSGDIPYCTPTEFLRFHDANQVGQLVRDDRLQMTYAGLLLDPILTNHLAAASGDLESAALQGNRYAPADLAALQGNGRALLARLVATLAWGTLMERRGWPDGKIPATVLAARQTLLSLSLGQSVLPFAEVTAAGNPRSRFRTAFELQRTALTANSYQAYRFMGPPSGGAYTWQNGWNPGGSAGSSTDTGSGH